MKKFLYCISALVSFISFSSPIEASNCKLTIYTQSKAITILAEQARTEKEKEQGLMFRKQLDENKGMLFIYNQPQNLSFWMKNTLIPLDVIFIDANKKIVDIQTMPPCIQAICPSYSSRQPAQYALEINGGLSKKWGITINDQVR